MATTVYEGKTKVHFLPTCANTDAPTVAEITAGKNWTPYMTKDGVQPPTGQNFVDDSSLDETFDAQAIGSWGGAPLTLIFRRDDTSETDTWEYITRGLKGFVLITDFGAAIATETCQVYPVEAHQPTLMNSATNEVQKFTAAFAVTSEPSMSATISAT